MPTRPGDALLDFQIETAPPVYLANRLYDDVEIPEMARVLCAAVFLVHEKAEHASSTSMTARATQRGRITPF
jgi:hypothetical protein